VIFMRVEFALLVIHCFFLKPMHAALIPGPLTFLFPLAWNFSCQQISLQILACCEQLKKVLDVIPIATSRYCIV